MCLGIPAKLVEIEDSISGKVEIGGIRRRINLSFVEDVRIGDYVIVHAGFAITKLDKEEAEKTLKILRELAQEIEMEDEGIEDV